MQFFKPFPTLGLMVMCGIGFYAATSGYEAVGERGTV